MMPNAPEIRRTAAALAAAALHEMLPGVELLGGGETDTGFFYQFFSTTPLVPETPRMIEERMRQIIREKRPLREMEMVAYSAKELFLKEGHSAAVDALEELEPKELVSVLRVGDFIDLAEGPFCTAVDGVAAFQILSIASLGDQEYRLEGCAARAKDELKALVRKLARYADGNHLILGQKLGLWKCFGSRILWLEKGLRARKELLRQLKEKLGKESREVAAQDDSLIEQFSLTKGRALFRVVDRVADPEGNAGLFEDVCQTRFELFLLSRENSLLQTIEETLMILGFHRFLCSDGQSPREKRKEWTVEDGLGRPHAAVVLSGDETPLRVSIGVERILALLLESTPGELPQWLTTENRTFD